MKILAFFPLFSLFYRIFQKRASRFENKQKWFEIMSCRSHVQKMSDLTRVVKPENLDLVCRSPTQYILSFWLFKNKNENETEGVQNINDGLLGLCPTRQKERVRVYPRTLNRPPFVKNSRTIDILTNIP